MPIESDIQLERQLRQLKLSGVLESLDHRILECRQNDIDYRSFLALLLQDELELRYARKIQRLITRAGFGIEQTFETFDMGLSTGIDRTLVRELTTCAFVGRGEAILLTGPPGTGKTHLARVDLFILDEFAFCKIDQASSEWPRRCHIAERDRRRSIRIAIHCDDQ